jgi:hypothetical protein
MVGYPPLPPDDPSPNPTDETRKKRLDFWHGLCDAVREHKEKPRDPFVALKGWNASASKRLCSGAQSKQFDAYFFDADGNRYRSRPEVLKFLDSGIKGKKAKVTTKTNATVKDQKKGKQQEEKGSGRGKGEVAGNDAEWVETREKGAQTVSLRQNQLKRKTSEAREEWAKLPISSSMSPRFQQEQQRHPHFKNKRPKIIEQQPNIRQEEPKVTRRHDCKNFFNVVSSREKMDLIRMVTGATVTEDAKLPTVLVVEGTEQEVRNGVNKIKEMIESTRERNRLISERATKQSMKPLNVMSIISAVKGEDRIDNNNGPINSNGTHVPMECSPPTLADAFVPEAVRVGTDTFINKVRTSIRENKMFSLVGSTGREAYRFVKQHGDVAADTLFEGLKELADESVETSHVSTGGGSNDDDNKLEIERKIIPLAVCSAIVKAAIEDARISEGTSSEVLSNAVNAKGFVIEYIQKYLRPMLRGIMRGESQMSQDINLRKRAYEVAKKTQLKCIVFLDEWSNNADCGDLSKHETIQQAKDLLSELRRRAKDRIDGKHRRQSGDIDGSGAHPSSGRRLIDRVQRPEARIKIDSDLSIAMKKGRGENGDEEDHHEDLAFSLENQYGGFAGESTQLRDFSLLRSDLSQHLEGDQKSLEETPPPVAERNSTPEPPSSQPVAERNATPEPPSSQPAVEDETEEGERCVAEPEWD